MLVHSCFFLFSLYFLRFFYSIALLISKSLYLFFIHWFARIIDTLIFSYILFFLFKALFIFLKPIPSLIFMHLFEYFSEMTSFKRISSYSLMEKKDIRCSSLSMLENFRSLAVAIIELLSLHLLSQLWRRH